MQPGGHRFDPGILHQPSQRLTTSVATVGKPAKVVHRSAKREGGPRQADNKFDIAALAAASREDEDFLTTEYSAIGSFFDHITTQSSEVNTWSSY